MKFLIYFCIATCVYFVIINKASDHRNSKKQNSISKRVKVAKQSEKIRYTEDQKLAENKEYVDYYKTRSYKTVDSVICPNCNAVVDRVGARCKYCDTLVVEK